MLNFKFGIIWTAISTLIFGIFLSIPSEQNDGAYLVILFFIIFEFIGLYFLISGIKKIIKDKKTKKHGIQCYGIISEIQETGSYVNGSPEYKAILNIVNPETNQMETIEEIIGFHYNKYPINSYVLCKYYEGDINIEKIASEYEVPEYIKEYLVPVQQEPNYSNLEFSSDREYVTIDGIKYKKIE